MNRKQSFLLAVSSLLAFASSAQAQFVTSSGGITGPTSVIDFSEFGMSTSPLFTSPDPNVSVQVGNPVGRDVRLTYMSGAGGVYTGYPSWALPASGTWSRYSIGVNQTGVVRFSFMDGPVSGVGALMNYANLGISSSVFVRTLDFSGNIIDEVNLLTAAPIPTLGANQGQFRGFQYSSAQVYGFEFGSNGGNPSPIMTDLTFSAATVVPEPSAVALMAAGLAALGLVARRRKKA